MRGKAEGWEGDMLSEAFLQVLGEGRKPCFHLGIEVQKILDRHVRIADPSIVRFKRHLMELGMRNQVRIDR